MPLEFAEQPIESGSPSGKEKSSAPPVSPDDAAEKIRAERSAKSTERVRAYRARKAEESKAKETEAAKPITITDADVAEAVMASEVVWSLAVVPLGKGRIRNLTPPEAQRLGKSMAPLIKKYLPLLSQWQYEIAAGLTVMALVKECWQPLPEDENGKTMAPGGPSPSDGLRA